MFNLLIGTRVDFFSGSNYWPPDVKESYILLSSGIPGWFGRGLRTLNKTPTANGRSRQVNIGGCKIARLLKWSEGSRIKNLLLTRRSVTDQGVSARAPYKHTSDTVTNYTRLRQPWSQCADFHAKIKPRPHRKHD